MNIGNLQNAIKELEGFEVAISYRDTGRTARRDSKINTKALETIKKRKRASQGNLQFSDWAEKIPPDITERYDINAIWPDGAPCDNKMNIGALRAAYSAA